MYITLVILVLFLAITILLAWFDTKVKTDIFRPRLANSVVFLLLCYSTLLVNAPDSIHGTLLKYLFAAPYFVVDYFLTVFGDGGSIAVTVVMVAVTIYYLYVLASIGVWFARNVSRRKRFGLI